MNRIKWISPLLTFLVWAWAPPASIKVGSYFWVLPVYDGLPYLFLFSLFIIIIKKKTVYPILF